MKQLIALILFSGQAAAHSGAGTGDAIFHVHGVEYAGVGVVFLLLAAVPLLYRAWRRRFRA